MGFEIQLVYTGETSQQWNDRWKPRTYVIEVKYGNNASAKRYNHKTEVDKDIATCISMNDRPYTMLNRGRYKSLSTFK